MNIPQNFARELYQELTGNILPFWLAQARDPASAGFYGILNNRNTGDATVPRSIVMTARHLWTYSAASRFLKEALLLSGADYAYSYLSRHFVDRTKGGVYWEVNADGKAADSRKQIYGQAFAVYGLSEYACALVEFGRNKDAELAFDLAYSIFAAVQNHALDKESGGYFEAFGEQWQYIEDKRLSPIDMNCDKSMNTNLHVLEAWTGILRAIKLLYPKDIQHKQAIEDALQHLICVIVARIFGEDKHLNLFFTKEWASLNDAISFGHDIEASWLLWEAVEELGNKSITANLRSFVLKIAETSLREGFDGTALDNEVHNPHNTPPGQRDKTRIWWSQAEALVGYFNAYQLSNDEVYLDAALKQWEWIKRYQRDNAGGDWFWAVAPDGKPDLTQPKGGNWKTPYHNARCCMEVLRRIDEVRIASYYETRLNLIKAEHNRLVTRKNVPLDLDENGAPGNGIYKRYKYPVLTAAHTPLFWRYDFDKKSNPLLLERMGINATFNAGAIKVGPLYYLVVRVEGADRKSFFAVAESPNGIDNFVFHDYPVVLAQGADPDVNVYDMRLTRHEDGWIYGVFCTERKDPKGDLSSALASAGIVRTKDLKHWYRLPDLKTPSPQQRNVLLHPEFVKGQYLLYTRPQDGFIETGSGGGICAGFVENMEKAEIKAEHLIDPRIYHTIKEAKNGAGAPPIKTRKGWIHIAHGVRNTAAGLRYVIYAFVTALDNPLAVIAAPGGYLLAPQGEERVGDVSNVVFSNGLIAEENGRVLLYYGASDTRLYVAETTVDRLLDYCFNTPPDSLSSQGSVAQRIALINKNLGRG